MKRYRFFIRRKYLRDEFTELCSINLRFSLIPTIVDKKLSWFSFYYSLKHMNSAFSFGGQISFSYKTVERSKNIFKFKRTLKDLGLIKNLYKENNLKVPNWVQLKLEEHIIKNEEKQKHEN